MNFTPHNPRVAIIILNWNNWSDTRECVESLSKIRYPAYEVIIVDNGSIDDSTKNLAAWCRTHTNTCLICLSENKGFSAGTNAGIAYALEKGYSCFWLLNNDTVVDQNALTGLVKAIQSGSSIGIAGSLLLDYRHPDTIQNAGVGSFFLRLRTLRNTEKKGLRGNHQNNRHCAWLWAASILIKSECLKDIGFLDEKYFYTTEDADLCLRAHRKNWGCILAFESRVWHKAGFLRKDKDFLKRRLYYEIRNEIYFYRRYLPHYLLGAIFCNAGLLVKSFFASHRGLLSCSMILQAIRDGWLMRMGKISYDAI
ncbi:MAG: glycosyltransferase family 2 protein [Candidatus Omnitrophica bacterium]|nr:glycosyltransferase family 2 protein [Candidatus Omnitrophota bacterium]